MAQRFWWWQRKYVYTYVKYVLVHSFTWDKICTVHVQMLYAAIKHTGQCSQQLCICFWPCWFRTECCVLHVISIVLTELYVSILYLISHKVTLVFKTISHQFLSYLLLRISIIPSKDISTVNWTGTVTNVQTMLLLGIFNLQLPQWLNSIKLLRLAVTSGEWMMRKHFETRSGSRTIGLVSVEPPDTVVYSRKFYWICEVCVFFCMLN
jgi:hypothetical protein